MNTIGNIFCFTDFGESHGAAIGGVIDGCPAGIKLDSQAIQYDLDRRAGRCDTLFSEFCSSRSLAEKDTIEWLSGVMDGITLGTPIAFIIRNTDVRSQDYEALKDVYRTGHADFTYQTKYGIRDYRGGGRASARETAARVVAGAIAKQILAAKGIIINAHVTQIGAETELDKIRSLLQEVKQSNDSIGGIISCTIQGLPVGIGEPIFDKLQARLAYAIMSINACKGFDYGTSFEGVGKRASEINSISGGALGGISDGTDFSFRCVIKPTPSIGINGRFDTCIALRTPVIVEAMTAMTILDLLFEGNTRQ